MQNLKKNGTKELIYKKRHRVTDVENKAIVLKGEKKEGMNWEIGIGIYTLLYIKQVTNRDLLCNTGTLLNAL